jgi:AraC-like DNA-binding protein
MNAHVESLLSRLELHARVFFSGNFCSIANFDAEAGTGHLHVLRQGALALFEPDGTRRIVDEPSVIFYPRPTTHRIESHERDGADLICASVAFATRVAHPVVRALPDLLLVPMRELPQLASVLEVLFAEASTSGQGKAATLGRLSEVVLLMLIRWSLQKGLTSSGPLAALADPKLGPALEAMHAQPAQAWTLVDLAALAGMSRARFAARFAEVVGMPPAEYLATYRIGLAQEHLAAGRQLKSIADECGYGSANALSRAFTQHVGLSPSQWLEQLHAKETSPTA